MIQEYELFSIIFQKRKIFEISSILLPFFQLRNPMENFTYATVKASAVDMYFRRQVFIYNFVHILITLL